MTKIIIKIVIEISIKENDIKKNAIESIKSEKKRKCHKNNKTIK